MRITYAILISTIALLASCNGSNNNDNSAAQLQVDIKDSAQLPPLIEGEIDNEPQSESGNNETVAGTSIEDLQGSNSPTIATVSLDLRNAYDSILTSLAGYDLELIGEEIALMADNVTVSALSSTVLPGATNDIELQGTVHTYPVTSTEYACPLGGSLIVDTLNVDDFLSDFSINIDKNTYQFDQCQLNTNQVQVLNGVMTIDMRFDAGRRHNIGESTYQWQNFQWQQTDGTLVQITADVSVYSVSTYDNNDRRRVSITEHTSTDVNGLVSGIKEGSFTLTNITLGGGAVYEYTVQAGGQFIDASGVTVDVTTDPVLYRKYVVPAFIGEQSVPFTGQMSLSASDGSALTLMAVETENSGRRQVDVMYTSRDGVVSILYAQIFTPLEVYAP